MHQQQHVKVLCATLAEALALFTQHMAQHGDQDHEWTWQVARFGDGSVQVRPPSEEELAAWAATVDGAEERAARRQLLLDRLDQEAAATLAHWRPWERWTREPWLGVLSWCALAGVPWMGPKERPSAAERDTRARVRRMAPGRIPTWFLAQAREELVRRYQTAILPATGAVVLPAARRWQLAEAFEFVYGMLGQEEEDRVHLPYRRGCSPGAWPAHLLGEDRQAAAVHLLIARSR